MKTRHLVLMLCLFSLLATYSTFAQEEEGPSVLDEVNWFVGPTTGNMRNIAQIDVPTGYVFAEGKDTQKLMEAMQNPLTNAEIGFFAPDNLQWFMVFEYDDSGYVKDDEKDELDANAMLKAIQDGTKAGNKTRRKRGWPELHVEGWYQPPRYNEQTNNLEWATRLFSEGEETINWNTRLLGRGGVMSVTLVVDPESLEIIKPQFIRCLNGYSFKDGQKYSEYREGDKLAKYGLSALVVGGATAVAAKTGLLKHLWKLIVLGFAAVASFFKKLFGKSE